jgi:ribosomal protein L11 methyltransferase
MIENAIHRQSGIPRSQIRLAVKRLVAESELTYTYVYGTSCLEPSFHRPVRISPSVVVKPYNMDFDGSDGDIVIDLFPGISFGSGAHPTTRLSIQGIEYALKEKQFITNFTGSTVLDIGTGSGILAIAALKLGIFSGMGVDTDACARAEALKNVELNGYKDRITIIDTSEAIDATFSLVTANLRFPDIMALYPLITRWTDKSGVVVISGLRPHETDEVTERYTQQYFTRLLNKTEKGWSCLVFKRT